jgi:hypothetical protein
MSTHGRLYVNSYILNFYYSNGEKLNLRTSPFLRGIPQNPLAKLLALWPLLLNQLPGLAPGLSPRTTVSWDLTKRVLAAGQRKAAALKTAVVALGVTGIMVAAAYAGMPTQVHHPATPVGALLGNNSSSPLFFPYVVPGPDYPAPVNLSLGGNVSLPQMVVTSAAGVPSYNLLAIVQANGAYTPILVSGMYSEALARTIAEGCPSHPAPPGHGGNSSTTCALPSLPVTWTSPEPLNISGHPARISSPVRADAFAVEGPVWAVGISSGDSTTLFVSQNGGASWTNESTSPGDSPSLLITGRTVLMATQVPSAILTMEVLSTGQSISGVFPASQVTSGSFLSSALIALPSGNASRPDLGILASDTDQAILFARSNDSGSQWNSTVFAMASNRTGNAIFDRIGSTSLFMPGGTPDEVAAVANGSRVFALWTSSVGDGVDALTAVSPDGGVTWVGPYSSNAPTSVGSPVLVPMPAGYVAAAWRGGSSETGFDIYGPDGRSVENVQTLSSFSGVGTGMAFGVDPLERLFFAWPSANASTLEFTGGLLSPQAAVENWLSAVEALPSGDFVTPTVTNNSSTNSTLSALEGKLGALLHMVSGPGGLSGPIEKIEQDLYPKVTNLPLMLGCTGPVPVCGHLHRGDNPPWILNESGLLSANTYLAVYAMWTLESLGVEVIVPPGASPGDEYIQESQGVSWSPCGGASSCSVDGATVSTTQASLGTESFTMTVNLTDPTTATFDLSTSLPLLYVNVELSDFTCYGKNIPNYQASIETYPVSILYTVAVSELVPTGVKPGQTKTVTVDYSFSRPITDNPSLAQLTGIRSDLLPTPDLLDLSVTAQGVYGPADGFYGPTQCEIDLQNLPLPSPSLGSGDFGIPIGERLTPSPPLVKETPGTGSTFPVTIHANASLPSALFANATGASLKSPVEFQNTSYANLVNASADLAPGSYQLAGAAQTEAGGASISSSAKQLQMSGDTTSSPLFAPFGCLITVVNVNVNVSAISATDIGATSAEISWTTNVPTLSQVSLFEVGVGELYPPTQVSTASTTHSLPLTGLVPFAFYTVSVGAILPTTGCLVVETSPTSVSFHTLSTFTVSERDLPYDSISQEGGGALVSWNLPATSLTFESGFLQYRTAGTPSSVGTNVPLESLSALSQQTTPNTYVENLSTLTPNTAYTVDVLLNLSLTVEGKVYTLTATGSWTFTYLKDTSGDGLSDAEKNLGWYVTYTDIAGVSHTDKVTANPALYATNGLVSDYVEKEFGLDPNTVDSAGSHMLDTWNLTFSLPSVSCPSGFQCWDESGNSNWDPFGFAQTPQGTAPGNPSGSAPGNFTQGSPGFNGPDSSSWGATQLWSYADLQVLQGLISSENVGWLRGILSNAPGVGPAITVWGKLSWGADPLTYSTPGDGIADGARVNPLHEEYLQIYVRTAGLSNCGENLNQGAGYANQFFVNTSAGAQEFHGFSASGFDTDGNCNPAKDASGNPLPFNIYQYFLPVPVDQGAQYQHVDIQLVANNSQSGQTPVPLQELPIGDNCQDTLSVQVDMFSPPYAPFQPLDPSPEGGVCTSGSNPALTVFGVTAVPAGTKSQTFLWLPDDNSTLSTNLPVGLQRYTGEQDFFLVVANVTERPGSVTFTQQSLTSDPFPTPWSSSDTRTVNIPLTTGIPGSPTHAVINFLIPRDQFLNSPFGQAVLQDKLVPGAGSLGGPLLSDISSSLLGGTTSQQQLECYFQTDAMASGSTATTCNGQPDAFSNINVVSITPGSNCTGTGTCGGIPSNAALSQISPSPALEGVVTLNVSFLDSQGNPTSAYLDALIAGLMDNGTGGINGTLRDVTGELPTLGLNGIVMGALANQIWPSGGIFGAPTSFAQPPPPPPCSGWGCVWNAVSGAIATVVGGLVTAVVGVVWTAVQAVTVFIDAMAAGLAKVAEVAVQATESALKAVGAALEAALQALLAFVEKEVTQALQSALGWITKQLATMSSSYATPVFNSFCSCSGSNPAINVPPTTAFGLASWGDSIQSIISITAAVVTVVMIVLTIIQVLSFGLSDLIVLIIGVVATIILMGFAHGGSTPGTSSGSPITGGSIFGFSMDTTVGFVNSQDNNLDPNQQQAENSLNQDAFTTAAAITAPITLLLAATLAPPKASMGLVFVGFVIDLAVALSGLFILVNVINSASGSPWTIGGFVGDGLALYASAASFLALVMIPVLAGDAVKAAALQGEVVADEYFLMLGVVGLLDAVVFGSATSTLINQG